MSITRRQFFKGSLAAFTVSFAAPQFLSEVALAQGATSRNLVILYLSGGNDSLSMVVPYNDPFYYSRQPTIGIPAGNVLQVGADASKVALGLHPRRHAGHGLGHVRGALDLDPGSDTGEDFIHIEGSGMRHILRNERIEAERRDEMDIKLSSR